MKALSADAADEDGANDPCEVPLARNGGRYPGASQRPPGVEADGGAGQALEGGAGVHQGDGLVVQPVGVEGSLGGALGADPAVEPGAVDLSLVIR